MASLEGTQLWWNGKLNSSADLLYYDKINVDVVHPPYAKRDRNSSYFFKTRKGYKADEYITDWLYSENNGGSYDVVDVEILWEDKCEEENGIIYYMCVSEERDEKIILSRKIVNGVIDSDIHQIYKNPQYCKCVDEKFFRTSYVKGASRDIYEGKVQSNGEGGIQINRVEGGAMRGYFTDKSIEEGENKFNWGIIMPGDYLVIYGSENGSDDGFCGQVRTITGINKITGELTLDSAWSGFQDGEDEVRGGNLSYRIFSEWGEVVGFTSGRGVTIAVDDMDTITLCDFGRPTNNAECIIASSATPDRIFLLYDNGWIHFGGIGRDKFFDSGDAMFCGEDKYNIECYRDFILAMGSKRMAVAVADSTGQYFRMYNQSSTIGLKNKYAYGEYNGDLLICSNDNRLLALKIASNVGQYMLEYEDIGQYVNPFLKAMLKTDKCYIGNDENQLRIFINTLSDVDRDETNTRTLILKYDTIFGVWTCDKIGYSIIRGVTEGMFFGDNVYTKFGNKDISYREFDGGIQIEQNTYNIGISAFLLENEENGQTQNNRSADLFSLAQLQKLIVLLGTGRYDDSNTQLKIIEYRNGYGYEQTIKSLTTNDWLNNIGAAYEGNSIELSECVLSDIKDGSNAIRTSCEEGHLIQKPIPLWEMLYREPHGNNAVLTYAERDYELTDHRVCINDEVYKMAPHMPLVVELGDQENYNSQIYVELVSNSDDVINFGGFLANLSLAPLGHKGADGEYLIEVDTGC